MKPLASSAVHPFLHLTVFAKLVFHKVIFAFYTYGRKAERVKFEDSRTVYVALRGFQHGFDVAHYWFQILAFVQEHAIPVGYLVPSSIVAICSKCTSRGTCVLR